nr:unnamed protein product [Spirometra erinaceieuropaei]
MGHSGISANSELIEQFAKAKKGRVRMLCMRIVNEEICLIKSVKACGSWEDDFDANIKPLQDAHLASYVLYRLDSKKRDAYEWLLLTWMPESADVRQKTLYSSTRATLRRQFGDDLLADDIVCHDASDMSLDGYKKHQASKTAPAPLTAMEAEYMLNSEATTTHSSFADAHSSFGGIAFPLTPEASSAVRKFAQRKLMYLQFQIDVPKECINVSQACEKMTPEAIASVTPANSGSYHLYRFDHTHQGQQLSTVFFIHAIAGYQSSIKERMLYSSCKGALINQMTGQFGLQIEHKLEVEDFKELSTKTFTETAHPVQVDSNVVIQRPRGPGGRGPRRLIT